MRPKLKVFQHFSEGLLPHELRYLRSQLRFTDSDKLAIFERLEHNCLHPLHPYPFDTSLDKRKYSSLKAWVSEQLEAIDLDLKHQWLLQTEHHILTDRIAPKREQELLNLVEQSQATDYHFMRFFELLQQYRHYLLIRLRYDAHERVQRYLDQHKAQYQRSRFVNEQLHAATLDIIREYHSGATDMKDWETKLLHWFEDDSLDGHNRYLAVVRLSFWHFNQQDFEGLLPIYEQLDKLFSKGHYYSKRLLVNYYGNQLILHSKLNQGRKAMQYGYWSIRYKNRDYLQYINNLAAVLLRQQMNAQALQLLRDGLPELKHTNSLHNKVGFAASYMQALVRNGDAAQAARYGKSFLRLQEKSLFEHRWHRWFSSYFQALLHTDKFEALIQLSKKWQLLEAEEEQIRRQGSLPNLNWQVHLSRYRLGDIDLSLLQKCIREKALPFLTQKKQLHQLWELTESLYGFAPPAFAELRSKLLRARRQGETAIS